MATAAATPSTSSSPNIPSQPRPWNPDFKHIDRERWICIYPAYLNSRKTIKEGRRVAKDIAIDNPVCAEIRDVCASVGLTLGVENKVYPREQEPRDVKYRGRVRVQLKLEDGTPAIKQLPTRQSLLNHLAVTIPKLKSRMAKEAQASAPAPQQQGGKGAKKKGKK